MALSKGWDIHFFVKDVLTSGRSLNVAKGQFAVIDESAPVNKDGRKVISDFAGLSKDSEISIIQGTAKSAEPRTQSNKSWSTKSFKISEVEGLSVGVPSPDFKVDDYIIGYDGYNDDTALTFGAGVNESFQISLEGEAIGALGYYDSRVDLTFEVGNNNEGTKTNQEIVKELVERMKKAQLMGGVPITQYVDIMTVDSSNPDVGSLTGTTDHVFYELRVEDRGDSNAHAAVQAQYNDYKVVKKERDGDFTIYSVLAPKNIVAAGSFVTGEDYVIETVGTTDFTAIGASANTVGTRFTATGAGTGTGDAFAVPVDDFTKFKRGVLKGCESCPTGYTEFSDGYIYSITLEDDGADSTATVEGISANVTAGSAEKVNQNAGVSYYTVVTTAELTQAEIDAFVTSNPSAVVELAATDVQEFCSPNNQETVTWTVENTCKASTEDYEIVVGDDECGSPRTGEIQAAYPDLTISAGASALCQTKYTTTVTTTVVCEECDPAFRDKFISEAPEEFMSIPWSKVNDETYDSNAKMGIRVRGKKTELAGSETYRDWLPFIATSVRLSVAGGYYGYQAESFIEGTGDRFPVKVLSRATEPEYLGGNLQELEEKSRRYFEDDSREYQNSYGVWAKGQESLLEPTVPYVDYVLKVRKKSLSQGFSGELNETFYYHFITEVGRHVDVEAILNKLATEAGHKPVQAFGKTSA